MKIGLGTVQFGLNYGISNEAGRPTLQQAGEIISVARQSGIRTLDTAAAYGESEAVLGHLLENTKQNFDIITKTPATTHPEALEQAFHHSLEQLKRPSLYGLMIHRAEDLLSITGGELFAKMKDLQKKGLVKKIGVSVYDAAQIDAILALYPIELIQIPVNILDQRLLNSGHLRKLRGHGIEVHARSTFLQGLLLMDPKDVSPYFEDIRHLLSQFQRDAAQKGLSPLEACLNFAAGVDEIDQVICGVNSASELKEIVSAPVGTGWKMDYSRYSILNEKFLNPALWPKKMESA